MWYTALDFLIIPHNDLVPSASWPWSIRTTRGRRSWMIYSSRWDLSEPIQRNIGALYHLFHFGRGLGVGVNLIKLAGEGGGSPWQPAPRCFFKDLSPNTLSSPALFAIFSFPFFFSFLSESLMLFPGRSVKTFCCSWGKRGRGVLTWQCSPHTPLTHCLQ